MNAGILPVVLLAIAVGIMLARIDPRAAWRAAAGFGLTVTALAIFDYPPQIAPWAQALVAPVVIAIAASTFLPRPAICRLALVLALLAGIAGGVQSSVSSVGIRAIVALPLALLFLPARHLIARGHGIGIKVAASWLIAIASLVGLVTLLPTPGYAPDHRG